MTDYDKFKDIEEFIDNLRRGGEIEFMFENSRYSLTHPNGKLCFIKVNDELSLTFFNSIEELLNFKIDGKKICDIVTVIEPYFRSF